MNEEWRIVIMGKSSIIILVDKYIFIEQTSNEVNKNKLKKK